MGNVLSCIVNFLGRKSKNEAAPAISSTSNTGNMPSEGSKVTKLPTVVIKALPGSMDCSDAITPVPRNKAPSGQSVTATKTITTTTITDPPTNIDTTDDDDATTTTPTRKNLPSCPTTFTKPWTFDPCPSPRKVQRPRAPLPITGTTTTAVAPPPKITPLPAIYPAMAPLTSDVASATTHPHTAACLMPIRLANKHIAFERAKTGPFNHAKWRREKWQMARTVVRERGIDLAEWEVSLFDEEEEDARKEKEKTEGGEKKKRMRCVNESKKGVVKEPRWMRSESEQAAWLEKWIGRKTEESQERWEAFTAEDWARLARVMRATEGEEVEVEVEMEEQEGCWVRQIF